MGQSITDGKAKLIQFKSTLFVVFVWRSVQVLALRNGNNKPLVQNKHLLGENISHNSGVKINSQGFGKSLGCVRASFPFQVTSEESLKIKFSFCVPFTHDTTSLKLRTGFWIWIKSLSVFKVNLNTQIIHLLATTHIGNSYNLNQMCCTFQKKWRTAPQKNCWPTVDCRLPFTMKNFSYIRRVFSLH